MSSYTVASLLREVEVYVQTNWAHTPIAYENTAFTIPETDPWIRLTVFFYESQNAGIGTECVYLRGRISVQVFTRYDIGVSISADLVDKVIEILENKDINGIVTYAANIIKLGDATRQMNRIESDWYQTNVQFDFETS